MVKRKLGALEKVEADLCVTILFVSGVRRFIRSEKFSTITNTYSPGLICSIKSDGILSKLLA